MRFSTLVFIVAISFSGALANQAYIYRSSNHQCIEDQHPSPRVVPSDISFEEKSAAHGITEDGCKFSALLWEATDGMTVDFRIFECKSPAKAKITFAALIKDATKIFERATIKTKDGKRAGQRIVLAFNGREPLQRPEVILQIRGSEVYRIESSSFSHALLFEKKWPNL
jgi:hypothetical protein